MRTILFAAAKYRAQFGPTGKFARSELGDPFAVLRATVAIGPGSLLYPCFLLRYFACSRPFWRFSSGVTHIYLREFLVDLGESQRYAESGTTAKIATRLNSLIEYDRRESLTGLFTEIRKTREAFGPGKPCFNTEEAPGIAR